ncbi:MAG: glycoside hydrolase family 3 C-terminal domain-containing protein [Ilyomonas sp.]
MKKYFLLLLLISSTTLFAQSLLPYKNPNLSADERAMDLLKRMTPEEKFWQMFMIPGDLDNATDSMYTKGIFGLQVSATAKGDAAGQMLNYNTTENALVFAKKLNTIQKFFVEKTRLGIPVIFFDEALHGLVRSDATVYPQAIALAATFDTSLMHRVSRSIANETKARGVRQILSPVINIASDVRWGRVEETYGEDPFLSSAMGVAFVSEFENKGIITTPKHFVANVGDGGRDSYPIYYNERHLEEIHFPPFRDAFEKGGARSVMTSYNSVDGTSSSSNSWLLEKKLKGDWNFKGFAISDANAVGGDVVLLHTAKNYAEAGANAINGGLDVIFQTDYQHSKLFMPPFLDGRIDSNRINDAVLRVLRAKFELGLFDRPYVSEEDAQKIMNDSSGKKIAKQAALESIVLLKNDKQTLPLKNNIRSIAVIGEDADSVRLGGYSGPGNNAISILEGIKQQAGNNIKITYAKGAEVMYKEYEVVASDYLKNLHNEEGLSASYFNNINLSGKPAAEKNVKQIDFLWTLSLPDRAIETNFYSARWQGKIISPKTGDFKIGLEGSDGFRLYINNKLLIDNWQKKTYSTMLTNFYFEKNKAYDIKVEFFEPVGNAKIKLVWNAALPNDWKSKIEEAVNIAKQADVAIVSAGIHEGEFQDRAMLSLPGHQEELINAVAKTGKPVIVVLVGGSAITMNNWLNNASAILDVWYPGEQGGNAVADVLFGKYNPAGRLPITFPITAGQLPLVYNHKPTGRADYYYDLSGLPLFPFGFGLSYTTFKYSNLRFEKSNIRKDDSVKVFCTIKNTGNIAGDEVAQLYIHDVLASVTQPVMQLKGFERIHLNPGESKEISFLITPAILSMLDKNLQRVVEPGDFDIMIGASSLDIRLKEKLTVK